MGIIFANNAGSTLATSITDTALSMTLVSGSLFPSFGGGEYTYVTLTDGSLYEIVKVTARSGAVLTVAASGRGLDGTTALSWAAGTTVQIRIPRITANELLTYAGTAAASETAAAASAVTAGTYATNAAASAALAATYVPLDWEGAWLTATSYQVNDAVKTGGSSYICLVAHTSGTFATDLAALKWDTIAEKGAAGAGAGDVVGPATATNNSLARYDGTTGKLLKDGAVIGTDVAPIASPSFTGTLTHSGDIVLSGSGKRITGDFSDVTLANRVMFQSSTVNGITAVSVIPNGSGAQAQLEAVSKQDPTNAARATVSTVGNEARFLANQYGSGHNGDSTYPVMTFYTAGAERMRINTSGNVGIGKTPTVKFDLLGQMAHNIAAPGLFDHYNDGTNNVQVGSSGSDLYINATTATNIRFTTTGNVLSTGTGGLGYGTGAGGTATQATSRTTSVPINTPTGDITLFTAAGSAVAASFTVTNSRVAATDVPTIAVRSATNKYVTAVTAVATGSFEITFYTTGGVASDTPIFHFNLGKGATS